MYAILPRSHSSRQPLDRIPRRLHTGDKLRREPVPGQCRSGRWVILGRQNYGNQVQPNALHFLPPEIILTFKPSTGRKSAKLTSVAPAGAGAPDRPRASAIAIITSATAASNNT